MNAITIPNPLPPVLADIPDAPAKPTPEQAAKAYDAIIGVSTLKAGAQQ